MWSSFCTRPHKTRRKPKILRRLRDLAKNRKTLMYYLLIWRSYFKR